MLQRRIEVPGRLKTNNQAVLDNLDVIQDALRLKRQVTFQYNEYNDAGKQQKRFNGRWYTLTPIRLIYAQEYYYLITFNEEHAKQEGHRWSNPYRVDRMVNLRLADEAAVSDQRISGYRQADQESPAFGVYATDKITMKLEFPVTSGRKDAKGRDARSPMNPIVDKLGLDKDHPPIVRDGKVTLTVKAPLSPQFFGWLMEVGPASGVRLVYPKEAVDAYRRRLEESLALYE